MVVRSLLLCSFGCGVWLLLDFVYLCDLCLVFFGLGLSCCLGWVDCIGLIWFGLDWGLAIDISCGESLCVCLDLLICCLFRIWIWCLIMLLPFVFMVCDWLWCFAVVFGGLLFVCVSVLFSLRLLRLITFVGVTCLLLLFGVCVICLLDNWFV